MRTTTAITVIFLMIVLSCFLVVFGSIHVRNQKMSLLHDTTPIFPSTDTITYISFLNANDNAFQEEVIMFQSEEEEEEEGKDQQSKSESKSKSSKSSVVDLLASNLYDSVAEHNGKIHYLGRCLSVMITSQQFDSNSCDFMMISTFGSTNEFESFRSNTKKDLVWSVHQAQIYNNNKKKNSIVSNIVLGAVGFHGVLPIAMNIYSKITGFKYDLETKVSPARLLQAASNEGGEERHWKGEKTESIANEILGKNNNNGEESQNTDKEPVYVFNWGNSESMKKEDQQKNNEYIWNFIPMLTMHNGGPIHIGSLETPPGNNNQGEEDGNYATLAAVYYPSRTFFAKIVSSAWMFDTVENKRAGDDSLAVATTPYYYYVNNNKPSSFSTNCTSTI